ncbi:MAG: hypothetical protein NT029_04615 [Armatimonadetes bacterium]|nr:hypothetical protein [Armatimonadota bacterium]
MRTLCCRGALAVLLAFGWCAPARADGAAAALLKKASDAVRTAKTYQAVYEVQMGVVGAPGTTMTVDMKAIPGEKGWSKMSPMNILTVDDGKTMVAYSPMANEYRKGPSMKGKAAMQLADVGKADATSNSRIVGSEALAGRKCTVIELTPKKAIKGPQMNKLLVYIDKSTSRTVQVKGSGWQAGPNGKSMPFSMLMKVKSEKFNVPLPASLFTFVPPKGAREAAPMTGAGAPQPGKP